MNPLIRHCFLAAIACAVAACEPASPTPGPDGVDSLRVEGVKIVNSEGEPVMLRGVSFGWHNWWPRFYNAGAVKWLKTDWGVNVVRVAMGIHHEEPEDTYNADPKGSVALISKAIDAAIENDIYVIIDFHSHHLELEMAKTFFAEMARKYGSYPNVIYEIFNEPIHQSWEEVKSYSEEVIDVIRAIDPDNLILVGNPNWDQDVHIAADNPIEGVPNILYTLHYYAATHFDYLRERGDYALSKGAPLFISESASMEASGDGPINYQQWEVWRNWAEERQISWITWSVSDKDETCSFLYPTASSRGGWKEADLRESGRATRAILRRFAGLE